MIDSNVPSIIVQQISSQPSLSGCSGAIYLGVLAGGIAVRF